MSAYGVFGNVFTHFMLTLATLTLFSSSFKNSREAPKLLKPSELGGILYRDNYYCHFLRSLFPLPGFLFCFYEDVFAVSSFVFVSFYSPAQRIVTRGTYIMTYTFFGVFASLVIKCQPSINCTKDR